MKTKHKVNVNGRTIERHSQGTPDYLENINVQGGKLYVHGIGAGKDAMYTNGQKFWNYGERKPGGGQHAIVQRALGNRNPAHTILPVAAKVNTSYTYGNHIAGTVEKIGQNLLYGQNPVTELAGTTRFVSNGQKNINARNSSNQFAGRGKAGGLRMEAKGHNVVFDDVMENEMFPGEDFDMAEERFIDKQHFGHVAPVFNNYYDAADSQEVGNAIRNVKTIKNNRK